MNALILNITMPIENPVLIFAIILFVIFFTPVILQRFHIPDLIGLILAGALLGPNGFHVMDRDSSIVLFGTVGLLYIMFTAGLEIDMADFKKNSLKGVVFGLYTFLIPMGIGIVTSIYLLDLSIPTSVLLASMYASHTLITYPVVSKYGVTRNRAVVIAIGGTIVTCVLALLVLAVVVGMSEGELNEYFWLSLSIKTLLFGAIVIFVFPAVCRWFFKHFDDKISQYILVLGLVFLASFLAEAAGLEAVIGAFLAGLSLNRLIPNTSALMNRIEFVGNAIFIPFFLIGVGMLLDYRVFFNDWNTLWVAVVMTVVATFSKYIAALLTKVSFSLTKAEGNLIFGLSNSQAAATLAAVMVGYQVIIGTTPTGEPVRLLSDSILNGTIVMILFTCIIASFVTQKAAQDIVLADMTEEESVDSDEIEEQILIPLSNEENVEELINVAVNIRSQGGSSVLTALHVISSDNISSSAEKRGAKLLEKAAKVASSMDTSINMLSRYDYDIVNGIRNTVNEHKITDIVLGLYKGREISDTFLGKFTEKVLAKCATTTIIHKPVQPSSTIKSHYVIVPLNAEREIGFPYWLIKVWNIAKNLGSKIVFYASPETISIFKEVRKKHHIEVEFNELSDWSDLSLVANRVKSNDALIIIMSRKGYPSYIRNMENIPTYLNEHFMDNNCMLIYPIQMGIGDEEISLLSSIPNVENIDSLDDVVNRLRQLFKKNK